MQVLPRHAAATAARPTARGMVASSASLRSRSRSRSRFVCASCQHHQQQQQRALFSSSSSSPSAPPPPPSSSSSSSSQPPRSGYARLTSRRLISIGGVDAPRFLQGIITSSVPNNVYDEKKEKGGGFYSGFLNATGRVLHDVFVYPDTLRVGVAADDPSLDAGQAFLIEVDADQVGELTRHLRRYMLRSKLKVRALDDEEAEGGCGVWHVWDDGSNSASSSSSGGADVSALELLLQPAADNPPQNTQNTTIVLRDDRAPGLGYRILSTQRSQSGGFPPGPIADGLGLERTDDAAYRVRRYLLGVPEGQAEIPRASALPLEANLDLMGGVDFRKGCYVGQELTIRTKHRGVVRKRVLPCVLYDDGSAPPQELEYRPDAFQGQGQGQGQGRDGGETAATAAVAAENIPADLSIGRDGRRGRSAGNWLRGVGNIGLALCRLQVMTDVQLPGETATAPFDPNDEFVMRWGGGEGDGEEEGGSSSSESAKSVKVKAFVPEWLRKRLDESHRSSH